MGAACNGQQFFVIVCSIYSRTLIHGHHSKCKDEWYVTYHRIRSPHSGAILGNLSGDCMYVYLIYWQHISKLYWKHFDYSAVPHLSWSLIVHIKMHWTLYNYSSDHILYTCQLFLRYKREIFILGVLGILKMTRSFPKIPEEVRSLLKKSEDVWRLPKTSEVCQRRSYRENSRSRGRYCHLFILHLVFVPYMGLS